ncbi:MAG: response regulator, partial [bacterium]|nr:response regulator [bacterium]
MNGLELIREIKKHFQDQNQALPYFIVITGNPDFLLINECEKYGVLGILSKPFRFTELIEIIEQS